MTTVDSGDHWFLKSFALALVVGTAAALTAVCPSAAFPGVLAFAAVFIFGWLSRRPQPPPAELVGLQLPDDLATVGKDKQAELGVFWKTLVDKQVAGALKGAAAVGLLLLGGGYLGMFQFVDKVANAAALEAKTKAAEAVEEARTAATESKDALVVARTAADEAKKLTAELDAAKKDNNGAIARAKDATSELNQLGSDKLSAMINIYNNYQETAGAALALQIAELKVESKLIPIGTICAWSGPLPTNTEWKKLWHVCDGTPLTGCEGLRDLLGQTYRPTAESVRTERLTAAKLATEDGVVWLPDFRGYFLRGADDRQPADALGVDPERPRKSGQSQADSVGPHMHNDVPGRSGWHLKSEYYHFTAVHNGERNFANSTFDRTGPVVDGGKETRPKNYAVHWVIRIK